MVIAHAAAVDAIPQLSYSSSTMSLSDKSVYPYFGRTYPSDALAGPVMIYVMYHFGWRRIAVVQVFDNFANDYVQSLTEGSRVAAGGVVIASVGIFLDGDNASAREAVQKAKDSQANIVVLVCYSHDFGAVLDAAEQLGMLTEGYA